MDFYELDENLKARKKEQAKRLPRKAAGVAYGNMMADLLCTFKVLNIPIDENTLNEDYVHVYDENSEEFLHEILDYVIEVLESIQATIDNKDKNVHTGSNLAYIVQHQQGICHFFWV